LKLKWVIMIEVPSQKMIEKLSEELKKNEDI